MAFLRLDYPNGEHKMFALVHAYACDRMLRTSLIYNIDDPEAYGPEPRTPMRRMRPAYGTNRNRSRFPVFELVDTETIQQAVWVQEDYDHKGLFWFIMKPALQVGLDFMDQQMENDDDE